jgi:preprotein translocase SecE subunit
MAGYKKDQGRMARMAAFWSLAALIFYGCTSLRAELAGRWSGALGRPLIASVPELPVLGVQLSAAFLIATLLFVGAIWLLYRQVEKPKNADLLIETEAELRKVTWPTGKEVIGSSTVVILSVLFLMAFLAGADVVLARIARVILGFGG